MVRFESPSHLEDCPAPKVALYLPRSKIVGVSYQPPKRSLDNGRLKQMFLILSTEMPQLLFLCLRSGAGTRPPRGLSLRRGPSLKRRGSMGRPPAATRRFSEGGAGPPQAASGDRGGGFANPTSLQRRGGLSRPIGRSDFREEG